MSSRIPKRLLVFLGTLLLLALVSLVIRNLFPQAWDSLQAAVLVFLRWVENLGGLAGMLVIGLLYIPATVLLVPGTVLSLAAGFLFGLVGGVMTVSLGSTAGATAAFLVGRYLARRQVQQWTAGNRRVVAIDQAVAREGAKIVFLCRLSPVLPFNLLNYAFGLTGVKLRGYILASWVGMLPGTVLYVYLGSSLRQLTQVFARPEREVTWAEIGLWILGGLATLGVLFLVTSIARRALSESLPPADAQSQSSAESGEASTSASEAPVPAAEENARGQTSSTEKSPALPPSSAAATDNQQSPADDKTLPPRNSQS